MTKESTENNSTILKESVETSTRERESGEQKKKRGRLIEYFKGVRLEMKKVVWPTQKELGSYTVVVLASCIAFALVFWAVDTGVLAAIKAVCF